MVCSLMLNHTFFSSGGSQTDRPTIWTKKSPHFYVEEDNDCAHPFSHHHEQRIMMSNGQQTPFKTINNRKITFVAMFCSKKSNFSSICDKSHKCKLFQYEMMNFSTSLFLYRFIVRACCVWRLLRNFKATVIYWDVVPSRVIKSNIYFVWCPNDNKFKIT